MDPVDFENNFRVGSVSRSECSASCNNCGVAVGSSLYSRVLECIQDIISDFFRSEGYNWNVAALVPCH